MESQSVHLLAQCWSI